MQQLPYKLHNKLKCLYDSDNTIICSVLGLINCAHEWICADSLTKLQMRAACLLCRTLKSSVPPLPGNSFSLLWTEEKEGITSSCWLPALAKPWRLFKWELQRRCMMGCLLLEEAHFTLRFKSLSDSEANNITYRLWASHTQPAQVQGASRNGTDRKRILFLSVGLEGFSGSVGSDGEWFSMNREPKCSKWGLRGCLVFRTVREGNYEKWLWSTQAVIEGRKSEIVMYWAFCTLTHHVFSTGLEGTVYELQLVPSITLSSWGWLGIRQWLTLGSLIKHIHQYRRKIKRKSPAPGTWSGSCICDVSLFS